MTRPVNESMGIKYTSYQVMVVIYMLHDKQKGQRMFSSNYRKGADSEIKDSFRIYSPQGKLSKFPGYFWYFLLLNAFSISAFQDWETYEACKVYLLKQLALIRRISFSLM